MHLSFLQDPFYQSDRKDPFYQSTLASPLISFDMSLIFRRKKTLSIKTFVWPRPICYRISDIYSMASRVNDGKNFGWQELPTTSDDDLLQRACAVCYVTSTLERRANNIYAVVNRYHRRAPRKDHFLSQILLIRKSWLRTQQQMKEQWFLEDSPSDFCLHYTSSHGNTAVSIYDGRCSAD